MLNWLEQYKLPLTIALILHGLLLTLLAMHWQAKHYSEQMPNHLAVIQATAVSAEQINPLPAAKSIPAPAAATPSPTQQAAMDEVLRQEEQEKLLEQRQVLQQAEQERLKATAQQQQARLKQLEKIKQAEAKKAAALKNQQAEAEKLKRIAQTAALKKEQERLLAQELADEDKALSSSRANSVNQGEIDKYKAMMVQAISRQWLVPTDTDHNLTCKLLIHIAPGGLVVSAEIAQSSGNPALDRSARAAVYKASPLPVPDDPNLFDKFRVVSLTVRPE